MTDTTESNHGDTAPGPGWWKASDGNWYPPEQHASAAPPPPGAYGSAMPPASNGLATAAMVTGIVSVVLFWAFGLSALVGIVAVVLGIVALNKSKTLPNNAGKGQAIAGIVTGGVGILAGGLLIVGIAALGSEAENQFREVGESLEGGVNTDPSDGRCNMDRYMQDPDC